MDFLNLYFFFAGFLLGLFLEIEFYDDDDDK